MSRFNKAAVPRNRTTNLAGGSAYKQSTKLELVSILLTSMLKDQHYEKGYDTLKRFLGLLDKVDPLFAAKAAVFARNEFGLRTISHVAAGEIASRVKGESWTKAFVNAVVRRVDDMTEILSYVLTTQGKPIPNSLKRGLRRAFGKFDDYQLAKYRAEGKALSLVDVVNLVHPVPNVRNVVALKKLVAGELKSTDTWEAKVSAAGQSDNKAEAKAEAWAELLRSKKIGYFALLRNLRNIETQARDLIPVAAELLTSEVAIRKSLVLPFRFTTAYEQVTDRKLKVAITKALDIACANVPAMENTLVVVDYSGSMGEGLTSHKGIGTLLGAVLAKRSDADFMIFGDSAAYLDYNPLDSVMTLWEQFCSNNVGGWFMASKPVRRAGKVFVGHGTNFPSIFKTAKKKYDRIFIFSDMQGWRSGGAPTRAVADYKKRTGADPFIYSMDLSGYGTMMFPEDKVAAIPGFSEKIFDLIKVMEQDKNALIKKIEEVKF